MSWIAFFKTENFPKIGKISKNNEYCENCTFVNLLNLSALIFWRLIGWWLYITVNSKINVQHK